jgi:hypothetical protein
LRLFELALILAALCASKNGLALRVAPPSMPATVPAVTTSDLLQRSLEELQTTLTGLRMEKWKGGSVRSEAAANIASIQKDLQGTLPGLIATADAAPGSLSKALPVSRNLDALYDVVLRVVDGARIAAPVDQVDQLVQAMANVEKGRQELNDRLQEMAAGAEKQVVDLQAAVVKIQATPPPVCPAPPAAKPSPAPAAKKKVVRRKPATPPPATNPQPAGTAKPNSQ